MNNYNDKYLKYKTKYINLKNKTKYINLKNKIGGALGAVNINVKTFKEISDVITLQVPRCIAFNSHGHIAITFNNGVNIYDSNWTLLRSIGDSTVGTGNSQFDNPIGIVFDRHNNMLIVDRYNNRIQKYDNNYKYVSTIGIGNDIYGNVLLTFPTAICCSRTGDIVVLNGGGGIRVFDNDGNFKHTFDAYCNGDIKFDYDGNLVVFHYGEVGEYALKYKNHIKVIDYDNGTVLRSFPIPVEGNRSLMSFVLDSNGHIILSNYYDGSIHILNYKSGALKCTIKKDVTKLTNPYGIEIDGNGNIVICDVNSIKVLKLS
jgi:DNA-binding beta-propeller fold protein YncE